MEAFTYANVIVVEATYTKVYVPSTMEYVYEHRFYNIEGYYVVVTENDMYDFSQFLALWNLLGIEYKLRCERAYKKQHKQQPLWKRMLAWCITNISRTIG
jgi:hypothetical protein